LEVIQDIFWTSYRILKGSWEGQLGRSAVKFRPTCYSSRRCADCNV